MSQDTKPLPDDQPAAIGDLRVRLADAGTSGTKAERALATYLLTNLQSLPFETAATVAQKVGVSTRNRPPMTST